MAMALETRRAGTALLHENERDHHRERGEEDEQEHADGAQPIVLAQARALGRLGQLLQPLAHRFQFRRLQDGRDHRRQRVRDEALRLLRIGGLAHGPEGHEAAALLGQAAHQIQDAVDDAPGQVAAQRADEHRADIVAAGLGDAERAGEGEDHDQPEEHFGDALDRVEHALGDFVTWSDMGVPSGLFTWLAAAAGKASWRR